MFELVCAFVSGFALVCFSIGVGGLAHDSVCVCADVTWEHSENRNQWVRESVEH